MVNKHMSRCKVYRGWHSSPTGELGVSNPSRSSEGVGRYVAFDKSTAKFFGRTIKPSHLVICNPLDARDEPAYILHERDEVMEKPKRSDSVWLSSIKEAVKKSGTTDDNWGAKTECLNQTLTDVLQSKGYDGILIQNWGVEFASPREREKLEGCKTRR